MEHDVGTMISAAGLAVVILSSVGGLVWRLARQEAILRSEFSEKHSLLEAKLYQVEIWSRDEFVRKGSFDTVVTRLEKGFADLRGEIGTRLDRMADKIDLIPHERATSGPK